MAATHKGKKPAISLRGASGAPVLSRGKDMHDKPEDGKERQHVNQNVHGVKIDERCCDPESD